jgi:hypothetical protein
MFRICNEGLNDLFIVGTKKSVRSLEVVDIISKLDKGANTITQGEVNIISLLNLEVFRIPLNTSSSDLYLNLIKFWS